MRHWSDRYLGRPYIEGEYDCAELCRQVLYAEFGRMVAIPVERGTIPHGLSAQIAAHRDDLARRTLEPREGDGVLMRGRGRVNHLGIFCRIDGEPWVLHAHKGAGQVVRSRVRDLAGQGLPVEGYYRWR